MADEEQQSPQQDSDLDGVMQDVQSPVLKQMQQQAQTETPAPQSTASVQPEKQPPTLDEFLKQDAAPEKTLPTLDEFLQQGPSPIGAGIQTALRRFSGDSPKELTEAQRTWAAAQPFSNIYRAFNHGYDEDFKASLSDDFVKSLDPDVYQEHLNQKDIANKSLMDGTIVPLAQDAWEKFQASYHRNAALQSAIEAIPATIEGVKEAAVQTGIESGSVNAGQAVAAGVEYETQRGDIMSGLPPLPMELARQSALGVLGKEGVYFGTKEATEAEAKTMQAAHSIDHDYYAPKVITPAREMLSNINDVARQIDPDTFKPYDDLTARRETTLNEYHDAREARDADLENKPSPYSAEISDMQRDLDKPTPPAKAANYPAKIEELQAKEQAWKEEQGKAVTPDMQASREKLQDINNQLQDIARTGKVSKAYRDAADKMAAENIFGHPNGEPLTVAADPLKAETTTATSEGENAAQGITAPEKPQVSSEGKVLTSPEQRSYIMGDLKKRAVAAGVPDEEADALSQLEAARYETLAQQYPKFSAQEWYDRESAGMKAARVNKKSLELAQKKRPPEELNSSDSGKIRLSMDGVKAMITRFKRADPSTIIHEKGHEWIDQLLRLSSEADAPEAMKKDAAAIRKWLGVDEGVSLRETDAKGNMIYRAEHEKVARGFERYFYEGTAPTKALAGVFSKFKQWLTAVYTKLKQIPDAIPPEAREVFDRLLTNNPEKTVIAPDHEAGKMLADIHGEEATSTPPPLADKVRDTTEKEIDSTAKQHKPEVKDALTNAAKIGDISGEATGAGEDGTGTGSIGSGSGTHQEPDTIAAGGSGTWSEGPTARAEPAGEPATGSSTGGGDTSGSSGGNSSERETTSPHGILPKPGSGLVDKAGNIRLDNLMHANEIGPALRESAERNGDFWDMRGTPISDAERSRLADSLGLNIHDFNAQMPPGVRPDVWADAVQKLTFRAANEVRAASKRFFDSGSLEHDVAYAEAKSRLDMIAGYFSSIKAGTGRTMRVFDKEGMDFLKGTQTALDQLEKNQNLTLFQRRVQAGLISSLDTTAKVSKFIQDSKKASFGEQILEYWINGLISGTATHTTYAIGNTMLAAWKATAETQAAAMMAKINEAAGLESSGIRAGETPARLTAGVKAIPTATSAALKALKTGVTTLLPGEKLSDMAFQQRGGALAAEMKNENVTMHELRGDLFSVAQGVKNAFVASGTLADNAPMFERIIPATGVIPDYRIGNAVIPVGNLARLPSRGVAAIHSFYRALNFSMEKAAISYRDAANAGLEGQELKAKVADGMINPSEVVMSQSTKEANAMTMMGEGGKFTQALSRITNTSANLPALGETKLLKFIDPFVKVSSNVITEGLLKRTPVGFLSSDIRSDLFGRNGAVARDMAQGRMVAGTALAILGATLRAEGKSSGSGPSKPSEASFWRMLGNMPHSILIGDMWHDVHRIGPLGVILNVSADLYDAGHYIADGDAQKAASALMFSLTQNVLDESSMTGIKNLIQAVDDHERYGEAYIKNFATSLIPFSVASAQAARAIDPYERETRTVFEAIKSKIPFWSETLFPRRDLWGEPIENKTALGGAALTAIYETKLNTDPVNQALLRMGQFPSMPKREIKGVQLSEQQYDDFSRIAGRMAKQQLDKIIIQPGFSKMPMEAQKETVRNIVRSSREYAQGAVMMQYPDIGQQAYQNKQTAMAR